MRQIVFLQLFGLILTIKKSFGDPIIVQTKYGKIEGFEYNHSNGKSHVFLGIPFAKPPVGNLRFEKPEEPEAWEDVYQAKQFRNDCSPHYSLVATFSSYSGEDCLTLNVIKPNKAKNAPVLIWIHGGGYAIGSASQHGYEVFAEKYTSQGIIVVSIQYRLGFLGFLFDGFELKGNLGLFDQALALKFIKENIEHFGGDKNKITVWGYSAGGASVSQLSLSPYSRELFDQNIIMSSSSLASWATGSTVEFHSNSLAEAVGCEDVNNRKQCLKEKTLDELFDGVEKIGPVSKNIDILKWAPIIDGDFFTAHPADLIENSPIKPTIIGLSDKEASYFTIANMGRVLSDFGIAPEDISKYDKKYITDIIKKKILYNERYGNEKEKVKNEIVNFYLNNGNKTIDGYFINQYTQLISDILFNVPIIREIQKRVEVKTPVYTYLFKYYNDKIWKDYIPNYSKGSPHANEYHYLFEMPVLMKHLNIQNNLEEKKVQKDLLDLVITFTKNGKPKLDEIEWEAVKNVNKINFVNIDGKSIKEEIGLFKESVEFWNKLRDEHNFDLIDPTFKNSNQQQHIEL